VIDFLRVLEPNSAATVQNVVGGRSEIAKRDIDLLSGVVQNRDVDSVLSKETCCFSGRRFISNEVDRDTLAAQNSAYRIDRRQRGECGAAMPRPVDDDGRLARSRFLERLLLSGVVDCSRISSNRAQD